MYQMYAQEMESPFAETVGDRLTSSVTNTEFMGALLDGVRLETTFPNSDQQFDVNNRLSQSLEQVAKVIKTREARNVEYP